MSRFLSGRKYKTKQERREVFLLGNAELALLRSRAEDDELLALQKEGQAARFSARFDPGTTGFGNLFRANVVAKQSSVGGLGDSGAGDVDAYSEIDASCRRALAPEPGSADDIALIVHRESSLVSFETAMTERRTRARQSSERAKEQAARIAEWTRKQTADLVSCGSSYDRPAPSIDGLVDAAPTFRHVVVDPPKLHVVHRELQADAQPDDESVLGELREKLSKVWHSQTKVKMDDDVSQGATRTPRLQHTIYI